MTDAVFSALQALAGGLMIGLASWLLLAALGRVAGISGIASAAIAPTQQEYEDNTWRWVFIVGLMLGGWLAVQFIAVPTHAPRSFWLLLAAGLLVGFGTVLGSGCTSGHGVCGLGRRSLRSLVATCTFMAAGFVTVWVVNAMSSQAML